MSGQPAARVGDPHVCPMATPGLPPIPHVGGPVLPAGAIQVLIGGQPAARMTDMAFCVASPPAPILKGAFPVPIQSSPAARMGDQTAHGGALVMGLPTVLIGLAGTAGNPRVGTTMCQAAANGRTSGATQQTYNNCGVESSRQLINRATGGNVSENALLTQSINSGNAAGTAGAPLANAFGGTGAAGRQAILAANGVPSTVQGPAMDNLGLAMSRGQGAIANIDAAQLWGAPTPPGSLHAITVTGVQYDDAGKPTNVIINDTGTGQCGQVVPIATFQAAQSAHPNPQLNVTTNPIW
jgi:uncharacterized Zn-binding protein involved in type VI secretion